MKSNQLKKTALNPNNLNNIYIYIYIYILKETVECPGCGLSMTQHTLNYTHKGRWFGKAEHVKETHGEDVIKPKIQETIKPTMKQHMKSIKLPDCIINR